MGKPSRDRGLRAERDAVRWLQANGFPTAERRGSGFSGRDIIGIPGLTVEVKDAARLELAAWVDQLLAEMDADGNTDGVLIHKRKRKANPGDWYATAPLAVWVRLARAAGYGDD